MKNLLFLIAAYLLCFAGTCEVEDDTGLPPTPNPNQQHQEANMYLFWDWQGNDYYNIDQRIKINTLAPSTFWALSVNFVEQASGAYMGLQTKQDGSQNGLAIFSIWDANGCVAGPNGSYCTDFSGEGTGKSVRVPFQIVPNHTYRFRLWRLEDDENGYWWGAFIMDENTNVETYLGKIRRQGSAALRNNAVDFVEYFGGALPCDDVPISVATFFPPTANNDDPSNAFQFGSKYSSYHMASCVTGQVFVATVDGQSSVPMVQHGG